MVYYGYRWYLPELQRWLNRDPIEERGGLNLYRFVSNDPANTVDLFGLEERKGIEEGHIENDSKVPLPVVDLDNKKCAIVPPGKKSPPNSDWDFVRLPDGTWWKIGMGELDIGSDGKPKWGQWNHGKTNKKDADNSEKVYQDHLKGQKKK